MEMDPDQLAQRLLDYVLRDQYQPVKPRVIARRLGIEGDDKVIFKRVLKRLVKRGKLSYGPNHLIEASASPENPKEPVGLIEGKFHKTKRGFGFVRPDPETRPVGLTTDIFIPASRVKDAAQDDRVSVKLSERRRHGGEQPVGYIVDILQRKTKQFVGTFVPKGGVGYVKIDGSQFEEPVYVGDTTAKQARKGDKVVVEMLRFPSERFEAEAVISEVLGGRHTPGVDTLTVIREFDLPEAFEENVLEDSRQVAARFEDAGPGEGRVDLSNETIITIDPEDARDFDDAISLERLDNGHWLLGVHIADVSHFVRPNSNLDNEALKRGNSVYLPDRVIPMLPELISNGLASLQPDRVRFTVTAKIEFTGEGVPVSTELLNSAIKSVRRFTYEEVDDYLESPKTWEQKLAPEVFNLLGRMHELAMILRQRRIDGGALELFLPETKIDLDDDGKVVGAHYETNTVSHQIIEEFMLAANVAVAQYLVDRELHFIRRIHQAPSALKLQDLTDFIRALEMECESLQSRFEIKRVVAAVMGKPEQKAVNYAVLRAMQKAVYGPEEEGHYALNEDAYCHFTSPIRRYPDLIIHRMVKALIEGKKPATDFRQLSRLGQHCSDTEQRAEKAERELNKLKLLNYLVDKVGMEMEATITGVEIYGLFVQGTELPAEGLVDLRSLPRDRYDYDSVGRSVTARRSGETYRLGDKVQVRVAHVDLDRRELDLVILTHRNRPGLGTLPPRRGEESESERRGSKRGRSRDRKPEGRSQSKSRRKSGGKKATGKAGKSSKGRRRGK
jgi:ribonuclease R